MAWTPESNREKRYRGRRTPTPGPVVLVLVEDTIGSLASQGASPDAPVTGPVADRPAERPSGRGASVRRSGSDPAGT